MESGDSRKEERARPGLGEYPEVVSTLETLQARPDTGNAKRLP